MKSVKASSPSNACTVPTPLNGRSLEDREVYAVEPGRGGFRCADVVLVGPRAQGLPAPPRTLLPAR